MIRTVSCRREAPLHEAGSRGELAQKLTAGHEKVGEAHE